MPIFKVIAPNGVQSPADERTFLDYAMLLISIGIAALSKPILVLRVVIPYLTLLFLFAAFVAWNGSVVLGKRA